MAQRSDKLDEETRSLYADLYRFHERFNNMGNSLNDWTLCHDEADYLVQKHGGTDFAYAMFFNVYDKLFLDRQGMPTEQPEQITFV